MTRYLALIDGKRGAYGVVVPDLPGCASAGRTTDEAYRNSIEAVRLWVEDAEISGEKLPRPRTLESLRADPKVAAALAEGAAITIVPVFT
jgi:predicted RNase H-like HicB family nuclease